MAKASKKKRAKPKMKRTNKKLSKKSSPKKGVKASNPNQKALWAAYQKLRTQVDKAWTKLEKDVRSKARLEVIHRDKNELLLALGECDYMARECMRQARRRR